MFWECQSCTRRESSYEVNDNATDHGLLISSEGLDFKRALFCVDPDKFARNGAYDVWIWLVRQFTLRKLTYISDRLPAISSLAKLIADRTGSLYMAGLWQGDLHGLAWFRDYPEERVTHESTRTDLAEFRKNAPTWSWIRMKESVMYRFNDEQRVSSEKDPVLISTDIQTRGSDPFGHVLSAVITLRASTLPVQCVDSASEAIHDREYVDILIDHDGIAGKKIGTGCFDGPVKLGSLIYRCKAVRIAERRYQGAFGQQNIVYFLLVQPDSKVAGRWRRVGMAMSRDLFYREFYNDSFEIDFQEKLELG